MSKRKVSSILILLFCMFFAGCKKNDPIILFNKQPITAETLLQNSMEFDLNRRIYYIFITQKPIKSDYIRVQIVKKDEKTGIGGLKIIYANDFKVYQDQIYYYTNYIVLHETGHYYMQIFSTDNFEKPLARSDFYVFNK